MTSEEKSGATLEHSHEAAEIKARLERGAQPSYLRDWVYGGIDGAITTFAIVSGAVGATLGERVIIILGIANLVADGLSMAAANYTGTKAEADDVKRLRLIEERHIRLDPEGERREVREIFRLKGFEGDNLDRAVEVITQDRERWIETMLAEEYGHGGAPRSARQAALSTFGAFVVCGAVPLLPFFLGLSAAWPISVAATALVFFAIGSAKSLWSPQSAWKSGLEVFLIGAAAASVAYGLGLAADAVI